VTPDNIFTQLIDPDTSSLTQKPFQTASHTKLTPEDGKHYFTVGHLLRFIITKNIYPTSPPANPQTLKLATMKEEKPKLLRAYTSKCCVHNLFFC